MDLLERFGFLAHSDGDRAQANGTTSIVLGHDAQDAFIHLVETGRIDLEKFKCRGRNRLSDDALRPFLGEVSHEVNQIIGDPRGPSGSSGDFSGARFFYLYLQQPTTSLNNAEQSGNIVVIEASLEGK